MRIQTALLLTLIFLSPFYAWAGNALTVNVIQSMPFGYVDAADQPTGTHWDYVQAISDRSGIKMVTTLTPRARLIQNLSDGSCDAAILFHADGREDLVAYAAPIRSIRMVAINRKGLPLRHYDDLYASQSIGLLQGTQIATHFDTDLRLKKEPKTSYEQMVRMLKKRRLDTIVGNAIALAHAIDLWDAAGDVEPQSLTLCTKEQWFQFSRKSPHLDKIDSIHEAMTALKAEGVFDAILTRYVGQGWQEINR
ncbi:MAG: amino acid ABC transporter substrate-binding protein [Desulfobacteraceae bacterium]|nr:amino acid ABC transporter substrate-binding protein [Desulfobacteraceae bacterium]MBC2752156.1 transporter substrate-binding domain-containing protein [Desulfobacteraceae bacterium]